MGLMILLLVVIIAAIFVRTIGKNNPQLKQVGIFVQAAAGIILLICLIPAIIVSCQQTEQKGLQQRLNSMQNK